MSSNNPWSVQAIIDRIEQEKRRAAGAEPPPDRAATAGHSVRGLWSCYSDPGKLTATQAHIAMQLHLECGVRTCAVRSRARTALVAAGRMILDPRAVRAPRTPRPSVFTLLRAAVFGYSALLFGGRHALR